MLATKWNHNCIKPALKPAYKELCNACCKMEPQLHQTTACATTMLNFRKKIYLHAFITCEAMLTMNVLDCILV